MPNSSAVEKSMVRHVAGVSAAAVCNVAAQHSAAALSATQPNVFIAFEYWMCFLDQGEVRFSTGSSDNNLKLQYLIAFELPGILSRAAIILLDCSNIK